MQFRSCKFRLHIHYTCMYVLIKKNISKISFYLKFVKRWNTNSVNSVVAWAEEELITFWHGSGWRVVLVGWRMGVGWGWGSYQKNKTKKKNKQTNIYQAYFCLICTKTTAVRCTFWGHFGHFDLLRTRLSTTTQNGRPLLPQSTLGLSLTVPTPEDRRMWDHPKKNICSVCIFPSLAWLQRSVPLQKCCSGLLL